MTNSSAAESPDVAAVTTQLQRELADGKVELPLLPNVAAEVLASSLEDQSDAARLAELIQQDQNLTSAGVRAAQASHLNGRVTSVRRDSRRSVLMPEL